MCKVIKAVRLYLADFHVFMKSHFVGFVFKSWMDCVLEPLCNNGEFSKDHSLFLFNMKFNC